MAHSHETPETDVPLELLAEEERRQREGDETEPQQEQLEALRDEYHDSIRELTGGDNADEWAHLNQPFTPPSGAWRYEHRMPTK